MHVNKTRLEGQERSESANEEESEEAQVVEPVCKIIINCTPRSSFNQSLMDD